MDSKCIVFTKANTISIKDLDVPKPEAGQILIKTLVTGVSTGTETRVLRGGEDPNGFPCIPGYENVGEVLDAGPGVNGIEMGDVVFHTGSEFTGPFARMWGAQVGIALISAESVLKAPGGLDPLKAIYTKVGAIALHGINRARVNPTDTVAVVGLGLIGHMAVQSAKAKGATVIAIDVDVDRLKAAEKGGADHLVNASEIDVEARVKELSNGGVSVAVDVTGIADTVNQTAQLVYTKPWAPPYPSSARVLLLGSYEEPVCFTYHPTLFANEPDIITSRDTTPDDMQEMMNLIASGKVDPGAVPDTVYPVNEAPQAYEDLVAKKTMRVVFDWR